MILGSFGAVLWFEYGRGAASLYRNAEALGAAVRACNQSAAYREALGQVANDLPGETAVRARQTATVASAPCTTAARLRRAMLAGGVDQEVLGFLELEAEHSGAVKVSELLWQLALGRRAPAAEPNFDAVLGEIARIQDLRPLPTKPFEETSKFKLGQALFFDPILSGNRDTACATCHLLRRGVSDAQALSVGTGATGLGEARKLAKGRLQQPRNALELWNRDNNAVRSMFWDGRVEVLDPVRRIFRSPWGEGLPSGFDNAMAVQAFFPIAQDDEMLGVPGDAAPAHLPAPHAEAPNELAREAEDRVGSDRFAAIARALMRRLVGEGEPERAWHRGYRELFRAAYPDVPVHELSVVEVGNALAHFEEIAFATRDTPWDAYLRGDLNAITESAKRGAILFFGKARCAACHSGPLFSDFGFHGLGIRDVGPGIENGKDMGRYHVTGDLADKYKFRTPPLRNVTLTAPYFHNGSAATLDEAIAQHVDPLFYADKYDETGAFAMNVEQIEAVSPILLVSPLDLTEDEIGDLKHFLGALEDGGAPREKVIPESVPSGLPVPFIPETGSSEQASLN